MPNTVISKTDVADATPKMFASVALGALVGNLALAMLVNRDFDNVVAEMGDTVNIPKRGTLTVKDKAEDTDSEPQVPTNTKIGVTLNKHKYVDWVLDDVANAFAVKRAVDYVEDAAIKIAEAIEADLAALYAGASQTVGTYGTDLTPDMIVDAGKTLDDLKCPKTGRFMVMSTKDNAGLLKVTVGSGLFVSAEKAGGVTALENAQLGRKYGFDLYSSQYVVTSGSSPLQTHNIAGHRDGMVLVTRPLALPPANVGVEASTLVYNGIGLRVRKGYDMGKGGTRWILDVLYGVSAMRGDTHLIEVKS